MATPPDYREEVDVASIDPLFFERQRSRYASRSVAYVILLNGVAALILLASLINLAPEIENADRLVDAMLIFGAGASAAFASTFFAYLRRTVRLQAPERIPLRNSLWWLSLVAAIGGAALFLIGLNIAGRATVAPVLESTAPADKSSLTGAKEEKKDQGRLRAKGDKPTKGAEKERADKAKEGADKQSEKSGREDAGKNSATVSQPVPSQSTRSKRAAYYSVRGSTS